MNRMAKVLNRAACLINAIPDTLQLNLQVSVFALLLSTSCVGDPMSPARKQIDNFKKNHSNQMGVHQGLHRKISYAFAGSPANRPVIFVHGSPGSREGWYSFLQDEKLISRFHMIVPDRPGYGDSGGGISEPSLARQADDLWSLLSLNTSGLSPILIGHSYGAPLVAKMAMEHPEIHALILVSGSIDPDLEDDQFIQKLGRLWGIRSLIPDFLRVCNEEITALKEELLRKDFDWNKIKTKVYAIHGSEDDLVPKENVDYLKKNIPGSEVIMIKENHFIPWNNPDSITGLLLSL